MASEAELRERILRQQEDDLLRSITQYQHDLDALACRMAERLGYPANDPSPIIEFGFFQIKALFELLIKQRREQEKGDH